MLEVVQVTGLKGLHVAVFDVTGIPADDANFQRYVNGIIDAIETWNCAFNIDAERIANGDVRFNAQMCLSKKNLFHKTLKRMNIRGCKIKVR